MREAKPPGHGWLGVLVERLDRAAGDLNPLLIMIIIGLAILNLSCYAALELGRLYPARPETSQRAAPVPSLARRAIVGLPES